MNLLALDASTEACAVGISTLEGELFQAFEVAPRRHTELLPKMLDSVLLESGLEKKQINGCIVGIGPGAFTGIRIGISTIQGIALGLNVPCFAVSSLHAIAQQAALTLSNTNHITVMIDARMQEIYCAEFNVDDELRTTLVGEERLISNEKFQIDEGSSCLVGTGVECIKDRFNESDNLILEANCYPTAESLFKIYQQHKLPALAPEALQASYIRNQVTYQNKPKI